MIAGILVAIYTLQGPNGIEIHPSYRGAFTAERCWVERDTYRLPVEETYLGMMVINREMKCMQTSIKFLKEDAAKL